MREFSIYAVIVVTIVIMVRYILLLVRKEIKPALAMWLFFSVAIIMSLITYRSEGGFGLLDNIMNTVDLIYVVTVCVAIFLFGDKSSKFTRFDRSCLAAVMIILLFWIFTQNLWQRRSRLLRKQRASRSRSGQKIAWLKKGSAAFLELVSVHHEVHG